MKSPFLGSSLLKTCLVSDTQSFSYSLPDGEKIAIMNRITLNSESAQLMHTREVVFEPYDAQHLRDTGTEPVLLRAKKELLEPDPKWQRCPSTTNAVEKLIMCSQDSVFIP